MRLGHPARHLDAVGSTMTEAAAWAADGAPHGALVTARTQTAGRGRHGRAWLDTPGDSLLLSLVLRPAAVGLPTERLGLVGLAAGLAVADAARDLGADAQVKWPNDVVVGTRKLAGVLADARLAREGATVVLGVGLNVAQMAFPDAVADRATSLRIATGRALDRLAPLDGVLAHLADALELAAADASAFVAAVEARLAGLGAPVTVAFPGTERLPLAGTARGLAPDGALVVATAGGDVRVHAGETTLGGHGARGMGHGARSA